MKMNYIELVNRFWELDESWQFNCCETRLYFYLLRTANRLGWMETWYHSDDKVIANVGVSRDRIRSAREQLKAAGLILFEKGGRGRADKTKYRILPPVSTPISAPNADPCNNINKPDQTKSKKEKSLKEEKEKTVKKEVFVPPGYDEVKAYCESRGNTVQAGEFVDFYASKGWMVGRSPMKDWKASVRTWEAKNKKGDTHARNQGIEGGNIPPEYGKF